MRDVLFVGDVQGCATELYDLLGTAGFDSAQHRLALCGDLINRGPDSAGVPGLLRLPTVPATPGRTGSRVPSRGQPHAGSRWSCATPQTREAFSWVFSA